MLHGLFGSSGAAVWSPQAWHDPTLAISHSGSNTPLHSYPRVVARALADGRTMAKTAPRSQCRPAFTCHSGASPKAILGQCTSGIGTALHPSSRCRRPRRYRDNDQRSLSARCLPSASKSGTMMLGCGSPGTGRGALPGRVISAELNPALWAPTVSQTCAATIMHADGATPSSWDT